MKYITYSRLRRKKGSCFICEALKKGVSKESLVLYIGERALIMLNLYPYNNGHLLIAPTSHVPSITHLSKEELTELMELTAASLKLLEKAMKPHGFNVGLNIGKVAGAGLEEHVHIHVVPRWEGDTNFMPVIADTKVIPEAIYETYERLRAHLDEVLPKR